MRYISSVFMLFPSLPGEKDVRLICILNNPEFSSPWAVDFYLFFAVNFNSGITTKLQNEEQCFHFCVMEERTA